MRTLNKSANPSYICLPGSNSCPLLINLVWSMSLHFEFGTIQTPTKDLWQFFAMLYLLFTIKSQRKFLKIQLWKAGHSNYMKFLHDTFLWSKSYSSSESLGDNCSLSTVYNINQFLMKVEFEPKSISYLIIINFTSWTN